MRLQALGLGLQARTSGLRIFPEAWSLTPRADSFAQQNTFFLPAPAPDCTGTIAKPALSARAESEDFWLRKRSYGGSCDERVNPSRSAVPEFRPRGRGQLQLNHSICWATTFDAGPVRRIQHSQPTPSARLATLVLDGLSFIPPLPAERKGEFTKLVRKFGFGTFTARKPLVSRVKEFSPKGAGRLTPATQRSGLRPDAPDALIRLRLEPPVPRLRSVRVATLGRGVRSPGALDHRSSPERL
jgi:hypothetical protein